MMFGLGAAEMAQRDAMNRAAERNRYQEMVRYRRLYKNDPLDELADALSCLKFHLDQREKPLDQRMAELSAGIAEMRKKYPDTNP